MKIRNVGYWGATGLVAAAFAFGGVMDVVGSPDVLAAVSHLGYPAYFATLIGVWKVLGAIAVVTPGFARVKEWAYAGMFFDLTGASISHAASGDAVSHVLTPLFILALMIVSYVLRPESRRVVAAPESNAHGATGKLATA
jgi:uncharacterized membrane protein YphA (DoxX/SURF4 family)